MWKPGESGNPKGRPKGRLNRFAMKKVKALEETGELPLDFLASVYRDESLDLKLRAEAARACLPFCHAKLSTTEMDLTTAPDNDVFGLSDAELIAIAGGAETA